MAQVIPLSEGSFTVDQSKVFSPFNPDKDHLQDRSRGSLLVEIQPFLLIVGAEYILIDTGLGFETAEGALQLHYNLLEKGIKPEQITKVLLSHLHKDHTGGIIMESEEGQRELSFPHAIYYVNKEEVAYAVAHEGTSYHKKEFELLIQEGPQVKHLGCSGTIDGLITYERSGGHSPFHQVFWIKDGEGIYFYGGDEASQYSQLKRKFMAKYDYDGRKSMELRAEYFEKGKKDGWTFLFYHDIQTPTVMVGSH